MDALSQELHDRLCPLPLRGQILDVGFSGGRDSVALLALLHGLAPVLGCEVRAVHVNHRISPHADSWQAFCEQFCRQRGIPLRVVVLDLQRQGGESLEALARAGRYRAYAQSEGLYIALAHHRDDQAETFVLQALRGAGPAGLAAMPERRSFAGKTLLRPLLHTPRQDIERWLQSQRLAWIEDESNADTRYRRNAVRHQILPLFETMHPGATEALARSARHCGEASELLRELAEIDGQPRAPRLDLASLGPLSPRRARNLLRQWLHYRGIPLPAARTLEVFMQQIHDAAADRQPQLELEGGRVYRFREQLHWAPDWEPLPASFVWKGESRQRIAGWQGVLHIDEAEEGIDASRLRGLPVDVRRRSGGERIKLAAQRPSQSLKNLFQGSAVPPWERPRWPMLYAGDELIAVPGLAVAAAWSSRPGLALRWEPAGGEAQESESP